MKEIRISNMNYADAKLVAGDFESHLKDDECAIFVHAYNNKVIIAWSDPLTKSAFDSIYEIVYDLFDSDSDFGSDTFDIFGFYSALKDLKDDHAIFIDFGNGKISTTTKNQ